jgi:hypothetical protein
LFCVGGLAAVRDRSAARLLEGEEEDKSECPKFCLFSSIEGWAGIWSSSGHEFEIAAVI